MTLTEISSEKMTLTMSPPLGISVGAYGHDHCHDALERKGLK